MADRPFRLLRVDQLEALFEQNTNDGLMLGRLLAELEHRSTLRASTLARKVRAAQKSIRTQPVQLVESARSSGHAHDAERRMIDLEYFVGQARSVMLEQAEKLRLAHLYEGLRLKLLDLTKRNRMLNYPLGGRSRRQLQIVDEVLEEVYARLVDEESSFRVMPLPEPDSIPADERTDEFISVLEHVRVSDVEYLVALEALHAAGGENESALERLERDLRNRVRETLGLPPRPDRKEINRNDHARSIGIDPNPELSPNKSKKSHCDEALQVLKYPDELQALMEKLRDEARLAEQEAGLSTLFLAFGFLEWYDSDSSDKAMFAPLLLLPVRIEKERVRGKDVFSIVAREARAEGNVSLQKFLETKFGRALPEFRGAEDEDAGSVETYLAQVRSAIDGLKRWQVRRWLVLGHFAFSRIAIYEDTKPERWAVDPVETALIHALLSGFELGVEGNPSMAPPADYPIDDPAMECVAPILIHDADASQHSALIDVMLAKNLVIQGPPGTGKSQTIANVIANAVAAGKTVLFLAEKQAALEVVKRRLDGAGLGQFCLELHSDRASAKAVVKSLSERCELGIGRAMRSSQQGADATWENARRAITGYVEALNEAQADDVTPFALIWAAIRGSAEHSNFESFLGAARMPDVLYEAPHRIREVRDNLQLLSFQAREFEKFFGHPANSPWARIPPRDMAHHEHAELLEALDQVVVTAKDVQALPGLLSDFGVHSLDDLESLLGREQRLAEVPQGADLEQWLQFPPEEADAALMRRAKVLALDAEYRSAAASLSEADPMVSIAMRLLELLPSEASSDASPREIYARAARAVAEAERSAEILTSVRPLAEALGLDGSLPCRALPLVAAAIVMLARLEPEHIHWFAMRAFDDAALGRIHLEWRAVRDEDADLHECLPLLPAVESLGAACHIRTGAERLRKSGLGRLIGVMKGETREVEALLARLGISRSPAAADLLDRIASHVDQFVGLNTSPDVIGVFGSSWSWRTTPIEAVVAGRKLRRFVKEKLCSDHAGEAVWAAIASLDEEQIRAIALLRDRANAFRMAQADIPLILDGTELELALRALQDRASRWRAFVDADPACSLMRYDVPLKLLAHVAQLRIRLDAARRDFAEIRFADRIASLASDQASVANGRNAVTWIAAVRAARMPPPIERLLLSSEASLARARLRTAFNDARRRLADHRAAVVNMRAFEMGALETLDLAQCVAHAEALLAKRAELPDFMALSKARRGLITEGLGDFLDRADRASLAPERLVAAFDWVLARRRAERAKRNVAALASGSGSDLQARRRIFAARDREKIRTDRELVRAKLLARTAPEGLRGGSVKTWTQMALLRNEFPKQRRHVPVRSLLDRAGNAIMTLKPCFMMSPLSLAKFVPPDKLMFDILIIDEASQMRPEDALGAILRARQIVVVGDPKQLPPTSFFDRSQDVSEDEEDMDDESILERCQKVFGDVRRLKWHYRSRCESLIRFSNEEFYKDKAFDKSGLITFPNAKPGSFSIDLVRVEGIYQARRNPAEAERIAEEAIAFMREHVSMDPEAIPSLGIVTLNTDQRDLVQEMLRRLSADDELVNRYTQTVEKNGEPLFVKNLENVQGDERDYIFVSMTYGKEPGASAMKQRFGPINSKHGHRRLNVLFTRARRRIGLFASFGSADVIPSNTSHTGVHVLKRYLEYAETRGCARGGRTGHDPESDFEIEVSRRLEARGYAVEFQVGVCGYRLDLGVRHPDRPESFLAGIECDGATYHSSQSARDRDRLREEVLRGLGWEILRIWSTDWFEAPDLQTERLVRELENLRGNLAVQEKDYILCHPGSLREAETKPERAAERRSAEELPFNDLVPVMHDAIMVSNPEIQDGDASSQIDGSEPLTEQQAFQLLAAFRETVIRPASAPWEPQRSILRDGMIETLVRQRISEPDDWFNKIPQFQRSGTNPVEKRLYLDRICAVVARIDSGTLQ